MAAYSNSAEMIAILQTVFDRVRQRSPNPFDALHTNRLIIRLRLSAPESEFFIDGRSRPVKVHVGNHSQRPELDVSMSADTLHEILLHTLSLKKAVALGKVRVMGPIWKTNPLAAILDAGREVYPEVLREMGKTAG